MRRGRISSFPGGGSFGQRRRAGVGGVTGLTPWQRGRIVAGRHGMAGNAPPTRGRSPVGGRQGGLSRGEITRPRLDRRRLLLASSWTTKIVLVDVNQACEWWCSRLTSSNDGTQMLPRRINRQTINQTHTYPSSLTFDRCIRGVIVERIGPCQDQKQILLCGHGLLLAVAVGGDIGFGCMCTRVRGHSVIEIPKRRILIVVERRLIPPGCGRCSSGHGVPGPLCLSRYAPCGLGWVGAILVIGRQ